MGIFEDIGAFVGEAKDITAELGSFGENVKETVTKSATEIGDTLSSAATEITELGEQTGSLIKDAVDISDGQK